MQKIKIQKIVKAKINKQTDIYYLIKISKKFFLL